jgi:hypothetical protein
MQAAIRVQQMFRLVALGLAFLTVVVVEPRSQMPTVKESTITLPDTFVMLE